MKKIRWYTLLEVILSVIIFSLLIGTIISIYINIKGADWSVAWKRTIVSEASDLFDTIHEAAIDFNIDYEEYFNLRWMEYNGFTSYGNDWDRYYCVDGNNSSSKFIDKWNGRGYWVYRRDNNDWWCLSWWNQKYLEYNFQHWELSEWENLNDIVNSGAYKWDWPIAIEKNRELNYLYLISNDKTERYYFRHVVDDKWRWIIQALRLVWFDAWSDHDFNSWWAFDWFIDTWACDTSKWFICKEKTDELGWYWIPMDENDWWQNITSDNVNVMDFKVDVFPQKDPSLAKESSELMDPYIKISITLWIYWNEDENKLTLSTTLSLKNTYSNFSTIK